MFSYSRFKHSLSSISVASLSVALVLASTASLAMQPGNETEAEMALAPSYCRYVQSYGLSGSPDAPSPAAKRWEGMMGKTFWHMHHYCWGQINMQRAMRSSTPEQTRQYLLGTVVADYYYVAKNALPNFVLLPEVYTRIGEVELLLSHVKEADRAFARARALKPDYWPGYSHWAEYLMHHGRKGEARKLVKKGLEYAPSSRVLREQYRVLGSKTDDEGEDAADGKDAGASDAKRELEATSGEDPKAAGSARSAAQ